MSNGQIKLLEGKNGSAIFSADMLHRYGLIRRWDPNGWIFGCMAHNPSTADQDINDPTITRIITYAKREGAGALYMVNADPYRATDPKEIPHSVDPSVTTTNCDFIEIAAGMAKIFMVAWGNMSRPIRTKTWAARRAINLARPDAVCLGYTGNGNPRHPLYVRADQPFILWRAPDA